MSGKRWTVEEVFFAMIAGVFGGFLVALFFVVQSGWFCP